MEATKKGPKGGPRTVIFVASAIVNGECVQESIPSPEGTNPEQFGQSAAREIFEKLHGVKPTKISAAMYEKKKISIKDDIFILDRNQIRVGEDRKMAKYQGWEGLAYDIKEQPEAVFFVPIKAIDESTKGLLKAQPLKRATVEFF